MKKIMAHIIIMNKILIIIIKNKELEESNKKNSVNNDIIKNIKEYYETIINEKNKTELE